MTDEYVPSLDEIREIFFRAMLESSWASGGESMVIPSEPHTKCVVWTDGGHWMVVDKWTSIPGSNASYGSTIVYYKGRPVWMKHFEGEYTKEASALVKQALLAAWSKRNFHASRGAPSFSGKITGVSELDGLVYINDVGPSRFGDAGMDDFAKFSCYEEVYRADDQTRVGWHRVSGMALI